MNKSIIIMGVDPGVRCTGYGILRKQNRKIDVIDCGTIKPSVKIPFPVRIHQIFKEVNQLAGKSNIDYIAIEKLFSVYKHPQTAIQMAHARGAVICAAAENKIPVINLSATHIKKSMTGSGRAAKQQIQKAVMLRLSLEAKPSPPDIADALAIALCFALEINKHITDYR